MDADKYQQLALRTDGDAEAHAVERERCDLYGADPRDSPLRARRLLHGAMGCATEAGELLDNVKRATFYGKDIDRTNVLEECGDLLWYVAVALDSVGYAMSEAMERNVAKLRARYPEGFTEADAIDRDTEAERAILQQTGFPDA